VIASAAIFGGVLGAGNNSVTIDHTTYPTNIVTPIGTISSVLTPPSSRSPRSGCHANRQVPLESFGNQKPRMPRTSGHLADRKRLLM
jgi:hypothetical protein